MKNDKCGIYEIKCLVSSKSYVGSSFQIYHRWYQHRTLLRHCKHRSPRLQQAWNKHGEANFVFSILEECSREELFVREQFHIDAKKRDYNSMPKVRVITKEMRAKMNASMAAIAAARTHCPHGHEYTPENTYYGKHRGKSDKRCKACNAIRIGKLYAAQTPVQVAARNAANNARYYADHAGARARQNAYSVRTRDAKRAYDRDPINRAKKQERRRMHREMGLAYG